MPAFQTAALVAPTVAAQAIFSERRAKKSAENIEEYPVFGLMNLDIALGQFLKGARAVRAAAIAVDKGASDNIQKLSNTAKNATKATKNFGLLGKIVEFTAYNVNHIIWSAAWIKGLSSKDEDKPTAILRELIPIATMRACEEGCNAVIGMPKTIKNMTTGLQENIEKEGAYKKLFNKKQLAAVNDFLETKKIFNKIPVKNVAGAAKGVVFVLASIGGYALGEKVIANKILGQKPQAATGATT